jgi:uncharacterized protein YgiM (DUF1202 family)
MKRLTLFLLCLAFMSLACLQSAADLEQDPTSTPAPTKENLVLAADQVLKQDATRTAAPRKCAVIIADEALHLRATASERSAHLAYMRSGVVVKLISARDPDWWLVQYGVKVGYARAKYMREEKCQ